MRLARVEPELGKQLHLIAVGRESCTFVHEHGDKPDAGGQVRTMPLMVAVA